MLAGPALAPAELEAALEVGGPDQGRAQRGRAQHGRPQRGRASAHPSLAGGGTTGTPLLLPVMEPPQLPTGRTEALGVGRHH